MNQKQSLRLRSAIASTILSFAAVSLAGIDKAQAAVLTYNFQVEQGGGSGFFKLSNSSLTGIGSEQIAVGEGRFNTTITASVFKNYYDLAGAIALFFKGIFADCKHAEATQRLEKLTFQTYQEGLFTSNMIAGHLGLWLPTGRAVLIGGHLISRDIVRQ